MEVSGWVKSVFRPSVSIKTRSAGCRQDEFVQEHSDQVELLGGGQARHTVRRESELHYRDRSREDAQTKHVRVASSRGRVFCYGAIRYGIHSRGSWGMSSGAELYVA